MWRLNNIVLKPNGSWRNQREKSENTLSEMKIEAQLNKLCVIQQK